MQPGIYDLAIEDYHKGKGISRSGIMKFKRSPFHYYAAYIEKAEQEKETQDMLIGSAFHTLILEPKLFSERYEKATKRVLKKDVGKEAYEAYKKEKEGIEKTDKIILSDDVFEQLKKMEKALKAQKAYELITDAQCEKSIYWNDAHSGLLCKARPDALHDNMVIDLKTIKNASPYEFRSELHRSGFYIQAAMIRDGVKQTLGKTIKNFIYVAIEKTYPYACAVYQLDEEALEIGVFEYKNKLLQLKECLEKNQWPSYEMQKISLPPYAKGT